MAVKAQHVSVGTTATKLNVQAESDYTTKGERQRGQRIRVLAGAADIFVGGSGVTAAAGFKVAATTTFEFVLDAGENLFGITASGTSDCSVIQTGT